MAAMDHNIIWFVNGQPQLQLEGETCLKVNPKTHQVELDYSTYGIKLLNGCIINVSRDCELFEIEPYPGSLDVFQPLQLKEYAKRATSQKNKLFGRFKNKYVNEDDKNIVFLNPYHPYGSGYYEEKCDFDFWHKVSHFICPVERKKQYKEQIYYYYDVNTFVLYQNTFNYNTIFIYDFQNGYSIVGLGGYGHECNPYLHFISRGYGEAFETAMCFECYNWLIDDILHPTLENLISYENNNKPLNIVNKNTYGFSLLSIVPSTADKDDMGCEYLKVRIEYSVMIEAIQKWINKFFAVYSYSTQWRDNSYLVPINENTFIINSSTFKKYNNGDYDIDEDSIKQAPKNAKFIVEGEEEQYYLDSLNTLELTSHSKFVYTKKQILEKWKKYKKDRKEKEEKEAK